LVIRNDANLEGDPIESVSRTLAEWVVLRHLERDPSLATRYGDRMLAMWRVEVRNRLANLSQATQVNRPELFVESIRWAKIAFAAFDVSPYDFRTSLECTAEIIREHLPPSIGTRAAECVELAIAELPNMPGELPSRLDGETPLADVARQFTFQLLGKHRDVAVALVMDAFRRGATFEAICHEVIQPTLAEVGRLWHMNEVSVSDEHYCTAAANGIVARIFAEEMERRRPSPNGHVVVVTSVGGDMHELAPRIVSDCLELAGWHCVFLGANTPAPCLVDEAKASGATVIAISASTNLCIGSVRNTIREIRAETELEHVAVIVGGAPFAAVPDLWREVGADGQAASAAEAVELCNRLVAARPSRRESDGGG